MSSFAYVCPFLAPLNMRKDTGFYGLLVVALLSGAGCRHSAPSVLQPENASFQFYTGPKSSEPNDVGEPQSFHEGEIIMPARPIFPLVRPIYPDIPVAERARWVTVGVRLNINQKGRVSEIAPSMVCLTMPDPHIKAFERAVEVAVLQWRFHPAESRRMEKTTGDDGTTWWRVSHTEATTTAVDVSFTFTASGRVKTD